MVMANSHVVTSKLRHRSLPVSELPADLTASRTSHSEREQITGNTGSKGNLEGWRQPQETDGM